MSANSTVSKLLLIPVTLVLAVLAILPMAANAADDPGLVKSDAGQMLPKPMAAYANCLTHEHNRLDGPSHCHGLLPNGVAWGDFSPVTGVYIGKPIPAAK